MNKKLFERRAGIRLDVGCGIFKQKGFVGLDIVKHPCVDIRHDIQKFPWPVPDNVCLQILMSHIWEHIEPKYRFQVMDELWRICRWDGQLLLSAPHAGSYLEAAHPAHYMCPNSATFQFFDPDYQLWHSCSYKKPLPWKIIRYDANLGGNLELIMEPRKNKKGKPMAIAEKAKVQDAVKIQIRNKNESERTAKRTDNNHSERERRKPKG